VVRGHQMHTGEGGGLIQIDGNTRANTRIYQPKHAQTRTYVFCLSLSHTHTNTHTLSHTHTFTHNHTQTHKHAHAHAHTHENAHAHTQKNHWDEEVELLALKLSVKRSLIPFETEFFTGIKVWAVAQLFSQRVVFGACTE